jgi:hypothetical protein
MYSLNIKTTNSFFAFPSLALASEITEQPKKQNKLLT